MARYITTLLLLFACIANAYTQPKSPHILSAGAPEEAGFSASRLARLDTGMSNWVKHKWINGSVALIARHGKVIFYKAYGYNDVDTKAQLPKDGIFRIASQTKAITTVAALMLWEEGKYSFDDPVSKYIPTFAHPTVLASFNPKDTPAIPPSPPGVRSPSMTCSPIPQDSGIPASAPRRRTPSMQKMKSRAELASRCNPFQMR